MHLMATSTGGILKKGPNNCDTAIALTAPKPTTFEVTATPAEIRQSFKSPSILTTIFGSVLALCAGCVNATTFKETGWFVSHLTGATTKMGIGAAEGADWNPEFFMIASFITGSALCGMIVPRNEIVFDQKLYGTVMLVNSGFLVASTFAMAWRAHIQGGSLCQTCSTNDVHMAYCLQLLGVCLASVAMGLQNGMCTQHYGAVVRTTHLTGLSTDLGLTLGRVLVIWRNRSMGPGEEEAEQEFTDAELDVSRLKMRIFGSIFIGFSSGATLGTHLWHVVGLYALLLPAFITSLGFLFFQCFRTTIESYVEEEMEKMQAEQMRREVERTAASLKNMASTLSRASVRLQPKEAEELQETLAEMAAIHRRISRVASAVKRKSQVV